MDLIAFNWTQAVSRIALTGGLDGFEHFLIVILLAAAATLALLPGRRLSTLPVYSGALFLSLLLARLPWFLPLLANPDEPQMLAGSQRLLKDPVFWRSVDGTTAGPLDHYFLLFLRLLGLPLNFATARFANVLTWWAAMVFLYLTGRLLLPEWAARLSVLPLLAAAMECRSSPFSDFIHYATECLPMAMTACAVWLLARCHLAMPHRPRAWLWLGFVAACLPFAKLQTVPIAALLIVAGLASALTNPRAGKWNSAGWMAAGASLLLIPVLAMLAGFGAFGDFYQSYVVNNLNYANCAVVKWTPASFVRFVFQPADTSRFLAGTGGLVCLAAIYALWRREARPSSAGWFAIALLGASLYAIWRPGRPFAHYLLFLFVPVSLAGMLVLGWGVRQRPRLAGAVFSISTLVFPVFSAIVDSGADSMAPLADLPRAPESPDSLRLSQLANPGNTVVIWGWVPRLYVLTGTVPGTREAQTERQIQPGPQCGYYRNRFLRDFEANPPKVFVDAVGPHQMFSSRETQGYESFPELRQYIDAHYEFADDIQNERLFVRRGALPPPGPPARLPLSIRCGGDTDAFYLGGYARTFHEVDQEGFAPLPPIDLAERSCPYSCEYLIPVPEGTYVVTLHFIELSYAAPGDRVFDVIVNGAPVLRDFDIFHEAGGGANPVVRDVQTAARNGAIRIGLLPKIGEAKINAIEIRPLQRRGT